MQKSNLLFFKCPQIGLGARDPFLPIYERTARRINNFRHREVSVANSRGRNLTCTLDKE